MEKMLQFEETNYSETTLECACVTGGGGCACSDCVSE